MYDIAAPYGTLITSSARIATWNVWGRYGPWHERERAIVSVLRQEHPDIVVLVEAWGADDDDQARRLAAELGFPHHVFGCAESDGDTRSGLAVLSKWPIAHHEEHTLDSPHGSGMANFESNMLCTTIDGPRGQLQVHVVGLTWRLDHSGIRQQQVRQLSRFVAETQRRRFPTVVCGDFNADPDSDEIRMLTGQVEVEVPGLVFYDAWRTAGGDGSGHTWSNDNPWAAPVLWPDRRIDYIFAAHPRRGGAGHPTDCRLIGNEPVDGVFPSDHYGVVADLRY